MEYRRITSIEDPLFKKMHQLMQNVFPPEEVLAFDLWKEPLEDPLEVHSHYRPSVGNKDRARLQLLHHCSKMDGHKGSQAAYIPNEIIPHDEHMDPSA